MRTYIDTSHVDGAFPQSRRTENSLAEYVAGSYANEYSRRLDSFVILNDGPRKSNVLLTGLVAKAVCDV